MAPNSETAACLKFALKNRDIKGCAASPLKLQMPILYTFTNQIKSKVKSFSKFNYDLKILFMGKIDQIFPSPHIETGTNLWG